MHIIRSKKYDALNEMFNMGFIGWEPNHMLNGSYAQKEMNRMRFKERYAYNEIDRLRCTHKIHRLRMQEIRCMPLGFLQFKMLIHSKCEDFFIFKS